MPAHEPTKSKLRFWTTFVLGLFLVSAFLNAVLLTREHSETDSFSAARSKYPFLDPAQGFYGNSDLLLTLHPLHDQLQGITQGKDNVTIYFEFLNTGANISLNEIPFLPGSLMKIPVAMAVMKNVDAGVWSLDDTKLTLIDADKNAQYGNLYTVPSGTTFTVRELLTKLLVDSDDTARSLFIRTVGESNIADVLSYLGLEDIFNTDLKIGARRYSNFLRALYEASYLSPESSQLLLTILNTPHNSDLLPAGIPSGINFSHKIGVNDITYSDSGIVYVPNRPYILTVAMQSTSSVEVQTMMKNISTAVYQYVTKNER
jgi:beta-lactamase class A